MVIIHYLSHRNHSGFNQSNRFLQKHGSPECAPDTFSVWQPGTLPTVPRAKKPPVQCCVFCYMIKRYYNNFRRPDTFDFL